MSGNSLFVGTGTSFNPYTHVGLDVERGDLTLIGKPNFAKTVLSSEVTVTKVDVEKDHEDRGMEHLAKEIGVEFVEAPK